MDGELQIPVCIPWSGVSGKEVDSPVGGVDSDEGTNTGVEPP